MQTLTTNVYISRCLHNLWRGEKSVSAAKQCHHSAEPSLSIQMFCVDCRAASVCWQFPSLSGFPSHLFVWCERVPGTAMFPQEHHASIYSCDLNHTNTGEWRHSSLSARLGCTARQKGFNVSKITTVQKARERSEPNWTDLKLNGKN